MYIKRKLKNTYINFQICEFLQPQNKGVKTAVKISVSTARIESRATDISLGRISGALAGASHWNKNIQIEKAAKRDKLQNAATALRAQYGFGDGMQRAQLESILYKLLRISFFVVFRHKTAGVRMTGRQVILPAFYNFYIPFGSFFPKRDR